MFPYPTNVLDHRLAVAPDALFGIIVDFVSPLLSEPVKAQGPGDWYFAVTGVQWDAEHKTINVNAMEYIPQERSAEEEWVDKDGIVHESIPASGRHTGSPMPIVPVAVTTLGDEKLTARIVATPGTDGEQYAIRLAGHIIRATGGHAAYKDWVEWVKVQTEPTPAVADIGGADLKPWEKIPDVGYDHQMVRLWREGFEASEIGYKVGKKAGKTITNRLCELRKIHGAEIIPYRRTTKRTPPG